jgi:arylsulfatase A-like enzyme
MDINKMFLSTLALGMATAGFCASMKSESSSKKPNILFILTDDHRTSAMGYKYTFQTDPIRDEYMQESCPMLLRESGYYTGFYGKLGVKYEHLDRLFDLSIKVPLIIYDPRVL